MRRRLRSESGVTIVEAIVVSTLLVIVLGGTLTAWASFEDTSGDKVRQNEAQQEARRAIDQVQAELRNLASPTNELPQAVEKATSGDLVFQSIASAKPAGSLNERNARRVRYCLDTGGRRVWRQEQNWTTAAPPALPPTAACPEPASAGGWAAGRVVARDAVNGAARPLFTYNSASLDEITEIGVRLWVDADPARRPYETELASGAFLRNQNRRPSASFTATPSGSQVVLNGSASTDPEGRALSYEWYDGSALVGEGIVYTYAPSQPGQHTMKLTVKDPAGLSSTAATQSVCVPGPETPCP
jgi:type II secretory pathway pseudopilin PulG